MKSLKIYLTILFIIIYSLTGNGQVNLEDGLQAYFPFNGNAIGESVNTYVGINNDATLTTDRNGNDASAYDFSGGDKYLSFGNILNETFSGMGNMFSISLWIQPSTNTMTNNVIIGKVSDSGCNENERQFVMRIFENQRLSFTYYSSLQTGSARRLNTISSLNLVDEWYHIVLLYDGSTNASDGVDRVKMYVNCEEQQTFLETSSGTLGDIQNGDASFGVGNYLDINGNSCQSGTAFEGKIDDIRIYDRIINEDEIAALCDTTITSLQDDLEKEKEVQIFPNPTKGKVTINDSSNRTKNYVIRDLLGRTIQKGAIGNDEIQISDHINGVVLLELIGLDGEVVANKKIVVYN